MIAYTRLATVNIRSMTDLDPHYVLDLTDAQRDEMQDAAKDAYIRYADRLLAPYGAEMWGNGEIIGEVGTELPMPEDDALWEALRSWDGTEIVRHYIEVADANRFVARVSADGADVVVTLAGDESDIVAAVGGIYSEDKHDWLDELDKALAGECWRRVGPTAPGDDVIPVERM